MRRRRRPEAPAPRIRGRRTRPRRSRSQRTDQRCQQQAGPSQPQDRPTQVRLRICRIGRPLRLCRPRHGSPSLLDIRYRASPSATKTPIPQASTSAVGADGSKTGSRSNHAVHTASRSERKSAKCGAFAEHSDGLEPSTPSLPWRLRLQRRVREGRLPALISLDLCAFGALVDLFLEMAWAALRDPVSVPGTCPQTVRSLANASW